MKDDEIVVSLPRTEALVCIGTLRLQAGSFEDVKNKVAAAACRLLADRLYAATHPAPTAP